MNTHKRVFHLYESFIRRGFVTLLMLGIGLGTAVYSNATGAEDALRSGLSSSAGTTSYLRFDPTYNGLGYRIERFEGSVNTIPTAMALQPDGKVIVAARLSGGRFGLMRLTVNGVLDFSFAGDGTLVVNQNVNVTSLAVQPDGKIIVGGSGSLGPGQNGFFIGRFNVDGSTDAPFGNGGGYVTLGFATGNAQLEKLALRPDGRIVAVGYAANTSGGADFAVAALNSDGSPDQSFGGGQVTARINGGDALYSFIIQPDGKILAAGFSGNQVAILRFNSNGTLDPSFDGDGKIATNLFPQITITISYGLVVQNDGKVVVAGGRSGGAWVVGRYNADGSVDNSFSGDGVTETNFPMAETRGFALKTFVLPDGRIMVGGQNTSYSTKTYMTFARYNVDGSLDRSFDVDGRATFNLASSPESVLDFDFDAQGRVVAVGQASAVSNVGIGLMRAKFGTARPFLPEYDRDGDGRSDLCVFRPSNSTWYTQNSAGFSFQQYGQTGDTVMPTDFDGDGLSDLGVFRPAGGQWYFSGQTSGTTAWGQTGDVPSAADMNGDGVPELIAFRPSNNTWYIRTLDYTIETIQFGSAGDKVVRGDFDGDGAFDVAMYNTSTHVWRIRSWSGSVSSMTWGENGDIPVPADYDGDGATDIAVWRPSTGRWYIIGSTAGWITWWTWGVSGDVPVPADYDGDGKADIAVFRPSSGIWYIINSADQSIFTRAFGQDGDVPLPSAFVQ